MLFSTSNWKAWAFFLQKAERKDSVMVRGLVTQSFEFYGFKIYSLGFVIVIIFMLPVYDSSASEFVILDSSSRFLFRW